MKGSFLGLEGRGGSEKVGVVGWDIKRLVINYCNWVFVGWLRVCGDNNVRYKINNGVNYLVSPYYRPWSGGWGFSGVKWGWRA